VKRRAEWRTPQRGLIMIMDEWSDVIELQREIAWVYSVAGHL
jgi:nitrogen fixation/metabolism regulation signal transduction histidine kinase